MTKTNLQPEPKTFHIAFWHPERQTELIGVNYQSKSITDAVELYAKDPFTPAVSEIKYVFEIGKHPILKFGVSEC